jgi:hypothetical protein
MFNDEQWFSKKASNRIQINSIIIYNDLSPEILKKLGNNLPVPEIVNWIKDTTKEAFLKKYNKIPEVGSLNNAIGRWNEFIATTLLSEIVFDLNQKNKKCIAVFSLPNSQLDSQSGDEISSKFLSLFSNENINKSKISPFKEQILLPSSDYIIAEMINEDKEDKFELIQQLLKKQAKNPDILEIYHFFQKKLQLEQVKATVSLKTSNRSDRRYQPLFEAAIIKAIGYTLQQNWRYYMVASTLTPADETIFSKAIAPHGIALGQNFKLVDGTYLYNKKEDLVSLIESAIK